MRIGFIGAGKVGKAFGAYLYKKGFNVVGYFSKTFNSSLKGASLTNSKAFKNLEDLTKESEIVFITTNDDEIQRVCKLLVEKDILHNGQILVHMSGASSSTILGRAKAKGCFIYSMHPLQAFADVDKAVRDLENTVFSIEGDAEKICVLENMLKITGNNYFKINSEQKSIYHAAACVVSNYLVALIDYGLSLMKSIGIEEKEGYKALYPLIEGTIKNIYDLGTEKALTGPIARGDIDTVNKHLESFRKIIPDKLKVYKTLGLMTLDLAKREKLRDDEKVKILQNILKEV
ncbi:Predicted oxidoreductase, contains short-chain dehydrogenase (SDR) and DUF2520 domains [Caminicella sporogenes DSM 14501]|uniref:Predicted oxidoreductase, contains short-chain dehydrogenase (SDR) and DUF2520 domains n=1 Tax=Caminicella sporogenes DSM 14501 TaxID=1121266 RepID=A0A1M6P051_9FIRM|nr:Rossmann-like and DUF2520 domain-containing protein [Caminicella sporogenes]SHK01345.1 Predicted oxidoreductase, contains short-chain dehydrogenase (SDR) and DUF2520 domains [Caminicella sporogenes DSM 14501]